MPRLRGDRAARWGLAVQMPRNFNAPSHRGFHEVTQNGPWAEVLSGVLRDAPVAEATVYQRILTPEAWVMLGDDLYPAAHGEDPVLNWVRGTTLTPVQAVLDADRYQAFEAAYSEVLSAAYPQEADGSTLFPSTQSSLLPIARVRLFHSAGGIASRSARWLVLDWMALRSPGPRFPDHRQPLAKISRATLTRRVKPPGPRRSILRSGRSTGGGGSTRE